MKAITIIFLIVYSGAALCDGDSDKGISTLSLVLAGSGLIAAGFLGKLGEKFLEIIVSLIGKKPKEELILSSSHSALSYGVFTLIKIAMWYAIFGAIASIAFGSATIPSEQEIKDAFYAVGNGAHFLSNIVAMYISVRSINVLMNSTENA